MKEQLTVGSMFAGIGGICLAFRQNGCKIVWANEIDKYACKTYRLNFGDEYLVEGDIQKLDTKNIPKFDILTAGFPCQAFSSVGLLEGFNDPRGNLFFETARVINKIKPRVVFLENVANLVKHDEGRTFDVILKTLGDLGYYTVYKVMNAKEYGNIPQQRNSALMLPDALLAGATRLAAVLPGLSPLGLTLAVCRLRDLRTDFALRFTAMLTLGFSLCEFVYRLLRAVVVGAFSASLWLPMLVALVASTVAGYFALQYLKYLLHREKLRVFSYYCWDAAVIALILALINA